MQLTTFLSAILAASALAAPIAPAVKHAPAVEQTPPVNHVSTVKHVSLAAQKQASAVKVLPAVSNQVAPAVKEHTTPANSQGLTPPARDRTLPIKEAAPVANAPITAVNSQGLTPPSRDRTPLNANAQVARQSVGRAIVQNNCPFDVNLISTSDPSQPINIVAAGTSYSEPYGGVSGAGVSIKMSPDDDLSNNLAQFEYTYQPENNQVWYDISFVNGNPYVGNNQQIITGDASCPAPFCAAGDDNCSMAYLVPEPPMQPNWPCNPSLDLVYQLC